MKVTDFTREGMKSNSARSEWEVKQKVGHRNIKNFTLESTKDYSRKYSSKTPVLQAFHLWRSEFHGHDLLSKEYCTEPKEFEDK